MSAIRDVVKLIDQSLVDNLQTPHQFEGLTEQVTRDGEVYPGKKNDEIFTKVDTSKHSVSWHRTLRMSRTDVDDQFSANQIKLVVDMVMVLKISTSIVKCIEELALSLNSAMPTTCRINNLSSCFVEPRVTELDGATILRREFGTVPNITAGSHLIQINYTIEMEGCFQQC